MFDVALVKIPALNKNIYPSPAISPVCLPSAPRSYDDVLCYAFGWGHSQILFKNIRNILKGVGDGVSDTLQKLVLT